MPDLPPLIVDIVGNAAGLLETLTEVDAALSAFADKDYTAYLGLDISAVLAKATEADEAIQSIEGSTPVEGLNIAGLLAGVAEAQAAIDSLHGSIVALGSVPIGGGGSGGVGVGVVGGGTDPALAAIASSAMADNPSNGGGGFFAGLLAAVGGGNAAKGLNTLLWGGGSGIPFLGKLAAAGSLGSLAGFGPEHVIMTGIGLAGSAVGGALGGGLLAAGALGTTAVGMGTDLAGIGQAAGDIKNTTTAMNSLNTALAAYGIGSLQAISAQQQLNASLQSFSPVAQSAVLAAANVEQGFVSSFDAATGAAEKTGAQIISQLIQVAQTFLPTIGKYASENMLIIQKDLQPLLAWIQGPGLTIFRQLETQFQDSLPSAMGAFTQGIELVIKIIADASTYTTGWMAKLDDLFTKLNGPDWGKVSTEIGKLISDFESWKGLIEAVGRDIYDLFSHDAGTAQAIIGDLTSMLDKLGDYERSVAGGTRLSSIFTQHKEQILALLSLLPVLLKALSPITAIMPVLVAATIPLINLFVDLVTILEHLPLGLGEAVSALLGLYLILAKLTTFAKAADIFQAMGVAIFGFGKNLLGVGAEADAAAVGMGSFGTSAAVATGGVDKLNAATVTAGTTMATTDDIALTLRGTLTGLGIAAIGVFAAMSILNEGSKEVDAAFTQTTNSAITLADKATNVKQFGQAFDIINKQMASADSTFGMFANDVKTKDLDPALMEVGIKDATVAIGSFATTVGKALSGVSADFFGTGEMSKAALQQMAQSSTAAANTIVTALEGLSTITVQSVGTALTTMVTQAQTFGTNITTAIKQGYNPAIISQILTAGPATAGPLLQSMVAGASQGMVQEVNNAETAMTSINNQMIEQSRLMNVAVTANSSAVTANYSSAMAIDQQIVAQGSKATVASIAAALNLGVGQVTTIMKQYGIVLAAGMVSAGKSASGAVDWTVVGKGMVDGMVSGVDAEAGRLASAAISAATNAFKAATSALGIKSPSTVFEQGVGIPIVQGIIQGITGQSGALDSAISNMLHGAVPNAIRGGLNLAANISAVGSSPGAAGATTVLNVTTPLQVSGQTLAQIVTQYQLRQGRANGNVLGQYSGGNQTGTSTGVNTNAVSR